MMTQSKSKAPQTDSSQLLPVSFEEAVAELETLVEQMDSRSMGLDQLLTDYRRGAYLVKYCRDRLGQVRKEVAEIEQTLNKNLNEGEQ